MNNKEILVTGGSGTLGKALQSIMPDAYYINGSDYNLINQEPVKKLYAELMPDRIIHCAALVGGIVDNIQNPHPYFYENILMDTQMVRFAIGNEVEHFTGILSTCAYPDVVPEYPMTEDMLHAGPPAATNFSYGYAKRAMAVHIDAANKQYGTRYNYLIPCNLYSGNQYKDPNKAHFLDTLIQKIKFAQNNGQTWINLMGTGEAKRQFMLADDFARVIKIMVDKGVTESFNVCPDENLSIREIVEIALKACDATYLKVNWDASKPNGQLNKEASNAKFKTIFPDFNFTPLEQGIRQAYEKK
jgi:GDP-L-fucose synthase